MPAIQGRARLRRRHRCAVGGGHVPSGCALSSCIWRSNSYCRLTTPSISVCVLIQPFSSQPAHLGRGRERGGTRPLLYAYPVGFGKKDNVIIRHTTRVPVTGSSLPVLSGGIAFPVRRAAFPFFSLSCQTRGDGLRERLRFLFSQWPRIVVLGDNSGTVYFRK